MYLIYIDYGENGAVIRDPTISRKVGQYVVFSVNDLREDFPRLILPIPIQATYAAHTIAIHNTITDSITWFKHRHKLIKQHTKVSKEDRDALLLQVLASEQW